MLIRGLICHRFCSEVKFVLWVFTVCFLGVDLLKLVWIVFILTMLDGVGGLAQFYGQLPPEVRGALGASVAIGVFYAVRGFVRAQKAAAAPSELSAAEISAAYHVDWTGGCPGCRFRAPQRPADSRLSVWSSG